MTLRTASLVLSNRDGKDRTRIILSGIAVEYYLPSFPWPLGVIMPHDRIRASGRPVLAEDTGFSDYLPTGAGLVVFNDLAGAVAGTEDIAANYERHMRAARDFAEEHLDSRRCLGDMSCASDL